MWPRPWATYQVPSDTDFGAGGARTAWRLADRRVGGERKRGCHAETRCGLEGRAANDGGEGGGGHDGARSEDRDGGRGDGCGGGGGGALRRVRQLVPVLLEVT